MEKLGQSEQMREVVRAILLLARAFRTEVTAEGVETREQAKLLKELGCQSAQGFLFSRALEPGAVPAFLELSPRAA